MKKKTTIFLVISLLIVLVILIWCVNNEKQYLISNYEDGIEEIDNLHAEIFKDSGINNGGDHPDLLSFPRPQYPYFITEEMSAQFIGDVVVLEWTMKKENAEQFTHIQVQRYDGPKLVANLSIYDSEEDGDLYRYKVIDNEKKIEDITTDSYSIGGTNKDTLEASIFSPPEEKKSEFTFSNLCIWILSWFK